MDKIARTACFTGHRNIPQQDIPIIKKQTRAVVEKLINKGVIYFGNGLARGFDLITASLILEMKSEYTQISLILVLPCRDQTAKWVDAADIALYNDILDKADKVVYISDKHYNGCELVRNRHLADNSRYCICYLTQDSGGTAYTVNYAKNKGLEIYNVADKP